jgi:hypothetical protein
MQAKHYVIPVIALVVFLVLIAGCCNPPCASGQWCDNGICCDQNWVNCSGTCVISNNTNCGRCGNVCPGGRECSMGICCNQGETNCNMTCVDLNTDPNCCGNCTHPCPTGWFCSNGGCCESRSQTFCGGRCVDVQSDTNNCGNCSNACPLYQTCSGGNCIPDTTGCPPNQIRCSDVPGPLGCRAAQVDVFNCGFCGNTCNPGEQCLNGACCPINGDWSNCGGFCRQLKDDPDHCGDCLRVCDTRMVIINGRVQRNGECIDGICRQKCSNIGVNCELA